MYPAFYIFNYLLFYNLIQGVIMPQLPLPVQSRVPCISLNAFAFPVKDTVVEKIFNALGGHALVRRAGGKYASGSFNSLSMFYYGGNYTTNHVFVACHNGLCAVEFRKFSGPRFELVGSYDHIQLSSLSALFSDVTGLQFNKN